mgnify:CR=1 FL=1
MKAGKAVGKIARSLPVSGSYLKRKEAEAQYFETTIKQLKARNDEWAAEVRQLRGDDEVFRIIWPVFKEDLIAADYRKRDQNIRRP